MFLIQLKEMSNIKGMLKEHQIFTLKLLLRRSQNFHFLGLKNLSLGQFLRSSNSCRYHWISKLLVAT